MKNPHQTQLDTDQIHKKTFDESIDANRVTIVGSDFNLDSNLIAQAVEKGLSKLSVPQLVSQPYVEEKEIEKIVYIPQIEYREIEKQVLVPQIEYKTIEIPVITERIVTVEVPVVIKETEYKNLNNNEAPTWQKVCLILQTLAMVGFCIGHFLK